MEFIDSHAHINDASFNENWLEAVQAATEAGVGSIINNAGDLASTEWGIEQAQKSPQVFATAGIHPELFLETNRSVTAADFNNLRRLIRSSPKVVAVGEIGLDYTLDSSQAPTAKQQELFIKQLEIALAFNLPVTLHVRDLPGQTSCFNDLVQILKQFTTSGQEAKTSASNSKLRNPRLRGDDEVGSVIFPALSTKNQDLQTKTPLTGVFHCWTGTPDQLHQALELGFYISFSGILTYKSAGHIVEAARLAPLNKILVETDSPYLTPEPARSSARPPVNQPKYVIMTAEKLASIKNEPLQTIAEATTQNARRLFNLPD